MHREIFVAAGWDARIAHPVDQEDGAVLLAFGHEGERPSPGSPGEPLLSIKVTGLAQKSQVGPRF